MEIFKKDIAANRGLTLSIKPDFNRYLTSYHLGFSLIEVISAVSMIGVTSVASLTIMRNVLQTTDTATDDGGGITLAIEEIERQRSRLLPSATSASQDIGEFRREVTVNGCSFVGNQLQCIDGSSCTTANEVCEVIVDVTHLPTGESTSFNTIKITEEL